MSLKKVCSSFWWAANNRFGYKMFVSFGNFFLFHVVRGFFFLSFSSMILETEKIRKFCFLFPFFIAFFSVRYDDEPCSEMFNVFVRHPGLYN